MQLCAQLRDGRGRSGQDVARRPAAVEQRSEGNRAPVEELEDPAHRPEHRAGGRQVPHPDVAELMSGVVLTETVFNWPGLGRLAVQSVFSLDVPVMAGTVLFSAVLVLVCNLLVDLLYGVMDPRVQHG